MKLFRHLELLLWTLFPSATLAADTCIFCCLLISHFGKLIRTAFDLPRCDITIPKGSLDKVR